MDAHRWIGSLPSGLAVQARLLRALLDAVEADPRWEGLELSCSLAAGRADADLDVGLWHAEGDRPDDAEIQTMLRGLGEVVEVNAQLWEGVPRWWVQYADGGQIDLVVLAAADRPGLAPGAVPLLDRRGRFAMAFVPSVLRPAPEQPRQWLLDGWEALDNVAKYLRRGSLLEAVEQYRAGLDDAVEYLRAGGVHLHPLEREHLGDLGAWCELAVHLQCASGKDTLSLLNAGAGRVVGVDIAEGHIANARQVSERLGAAASWYRCDVLDTPHELDGTADLVYTGRGALGWVHDLQGWAAVVGRLLRPGGLFHVLDDHAGAYLFDPAASELRPSGADYFANVTGSRGWTEQYVGDLSREKAEHAVKHERLWPPSAVFSALVGVGLVVEQFGEHPDEYWPAFPHLDPQVRRRLPMTYTITARQP